MKIAVITITYNDVNRLEQWRMLYDRYSHHIYTHIIVDNASEKEYLNNVKKTFPDSVVLERESNGGCTGAYNDGIKYALYSTDCDAIAVIGNDTRVSKNFYPVLYDYLFSDEKLGMVSSVALIKDTDIINNNGHTISSTLYMISTDHGKLISDVNKSQYTQMVLGGNNLARRSFYEKVGLQDEKLFMYSDEIDTALRSSKLGIKLGVTSQATSMHYHIPYSVELSSPYFSSYLIQRNKVYLAGKHFGYFKKLYLFLIYLIIDVRTMLIGIFRRDKSSFLKGKTSLIGAWNGLIGYMGFNKYFNP